MKHRPTSSLPLLLGIFLLSTSRIQARDLSFQERVRAQEAIERVYYSHQIGAKRPFDQAVSRSLIEEKVRTYLKQSAALEAMWRTPVTAEALQREIDRIAHSTRAPARLEEIRRALGQDEFVIQECFARPALVNRLARSFLRSDARFQGAARGRAEALRGELLHNPRGADRRSFASRMSEVVLELDSASPGAPGRRPGRDEDIEAGLLRRWVSRPEFDTLRSRAPKRAGEVGPLVETSVGFDVQVLLESSEDAFRIAEYTVDKVSWDDWWSGAKREFNDLAVTAVAVPRTSPGGRLPADLVAASTDCVPDDTWANQGLDDPPVASSSGQAVWTGAEMLTWGGSAPGAARYDPLTNTWSRVSTMGAPAERFAQVVWTGSQMIVWGGTGAGQSGRYDPVSDTWSAVSVAGAPSTTPGAAIWTGTVMIVWSGWPDPGGGRYDPATDSWSPIATAGAPSARYAVHAVWSGREMIVWGGYYDPGYLNTGARYDPASDTWTPTSTIGAPSPRDGHALVWTGRFMIVWGGSDANGSIGNGARYDPRIDTWTPVSTFGAPAPRWGATATWSGSEMLIWGGRDGVNFNYLNTGFRYDPVTNSWTAMTTTNAASPRAYHVIVWTGSLLVVWGGYDGTNDLDTGARYDPASDSWTPMSKGNRPINAWAHTAVWTGNQMIVWGGYGPGQTLTSTGSRFDPLTTTWSATSTSNAPSPRGEHVAVWTGSRMLVWGGSTGDNFRWTGGRYDPISDSWSPTATTGSPFYNYYRIGASAVWTGTRLIVWGGRDSGDIYKDDGSRYDPESDTWSTMSSIGAPSARAWHTAIWTGDAMLVWGGFARPHASGPDTYYGDGGAYSPSTDSWTPLAEAGAPSPRENHSAVWTGEKMLIWGGDGSLPQGSDYRTDGASYDPQQSAWEPIPSDGAPAGLHYHTAIWASPTLIVWGSTGSPSLGIGGRYDAIARSWKPIGQDGAPFLSGTYGSLLAPIWHTAVWTGDEMIVWGGGTNTGSAYRIDLSPDADADGFTVCAGDCDDTNAAIHPGATETCDGKDDDCDGQIDEGFDVGAACTQDVDACHQVVGALACAADGTRSECVGPIALVDTTPPTITAGAFPPTLWPPNHRMVDVTESVVASDRCTVPTVTLTSIRSLEPDDAPGEQDGETTGDIQGADTGTADFAFQLRDERSGDGPGRAYEVTYQAVDGSGNASSVTSIVFVPHDRGGATEPIHLSVDDSGDGTWLRWDAVSGALSYRAIRGRLDNLRNASDFIDLGTVACIQPSSAATDTQGHADAAAPALGEAFFYLVAYNDGQDSGFGTESAPKPEIVTGGGCP